MKRKRKNKRGKHKAPRVEATNEAAVDLVSASREETSDADEHDNSNDEYESRMEVDVPSSTETDHPLNFASIEPDGTVGMSTGKSIGRVKVKLKTSKAMGSQSDTDKSSPQLGLDKQVGVSDRKEDSDHLLPEGKMWFSGDISKKPGSIKIKQKVMGVSRVENSSGSEQKKEMKRTYQPSLYTKQELDAALMVIKKVMKMDAAEPFNVPVNPEALGIPDYFDVIDTPMDFGTICSNLEKGEKYKNSEDVYMDVQFIWDNCHKYNSKGDYILDLLRRVKKNFMKNWIAAGLYSEEPKGTNSSEGIHAEDVTVSRQGHVKGATSKPKTKKKHGRRHKADCLCAICVLKRNKREREARERLAKGLGVAEDSRQEESSLAESPYQQDSSSNMDESVDPDADAESEDKEQEGRLDVIEQQYSPVDEKHDEFEEDGEEEDEEEENEMEIQEKGNGEASQQSLPDDKLMVDHNQYSQPGLAENTETRVHSSKGQDLVQHEEEAATNENIEHKDSRAKEERVKILEKFQFENPLFVRLCGALFPDNRRSVWNGPHSLVQRQGSANKSMIRDAVETLMK